MHLYHSQNDEILPPSRVPPMVSPLPLSPPCCAHMFLVGFCVYLLLGGRIRPRWFLFLLFFVAWFDGLNNGLAIPHMFCPCCASSPMPPPPLPLTFSWLLCPSNNLRPRPCLSLYFLKWFVCTPKQVIQHWRAQTQGLALFQYSFGEPRCQDLGALLPYQWRRAKPLDRVVVAAHFDCCVCICGCGLCEGLTFSYHTGRKSTSAKAQWPTFAHSYYKICA